MNGGDHDQNAIAHLDLDQNEQTPLALKFRTTL